MGLSTWLPKGTFASCALINFHEEGSGKCWVYQQVTTPSYCHKALLWRPQATMRNTERIHSSLLLTHRTKARSFYSSRWIALIIVKSTKISHIHIRSYDRYAKFGQRSYRYEAKRRIAMVWTRVMKDLLRMNAHIFSPSLNQGEKRRLIQSDRLGTSCICKKHLEFTRYTRLKISLRDPRKSYRREDENWNRAEAAIIEALPEKGLETVTFLCEAAIYGPKLELHRWKMPLGRKWQLEPFSVELNLRSDIQLEYNRCRQSKSTDSDDFTGRLLAHWSDCKQYWFEALRGVISRVLWLILPESMINILSFFRKICRLCLKKLKPMLDEAWNVRASIE